MKVYILFERPEIVVLVPLPVVVSPLGWRVTVHVPLEGRPFKTTLPVDTLHDGCVMFPITGAEGVGGCELINALDERPEVHPKELVTLKL